MLAAEGSPVRVLVAPNAFKGCLEAGEVADAICLGLEQSRLACQCAKVPLADGGDGTGALLAAALDARWVEIEAHDPLMRRRRASFAVTQDGSAAIIDFASFSGLALLNKAELDPLRATSLGVGEAIVAALDLGVTEIFLCLGGSATIDGGAGILCALGARLIDEQGVVISNPSGELGRLASIDVSGLHSRLAERQITMLCDVEATLTGPSGAVAIFGAQKGATAATSPRLEAGLGRLAEVLQMRGASDLATLTRGGAAGGVAAGLHGVLGARIVGGADHFLDLIGFDGRLRESDLMITGEGAVDAQTLQGKAPSAAARRAHALGVATIALAGSLDPHLQAPEFDAVIAIGCGPTSLDRALRDAASDLTRTARQIGNLLALVHPAAVPAKSAGR